MDTNLQTPLPIPLKALITMVILLLSLSSLKADVVPSGGRLARPGCLDVCGNVSIPFPFGIGANCFLDSWFEIKCNIGSKPLLSKFGIEVMEITIGSTDYSAFSTLIVRIPSFNTCSGVDAQQHHSIDLRGSPYNFSTTHNVLAMEGCPGSAVLVNESDAIMDGCATFCDSRNKSVVSANKCHGIDCCQGALPLETYEDGYPYSPLQFYQIGFYGQSAGKRRNCLVAGLIKSEFVDSYTGKLLNPYPVLLYWSWVSSNWPDDNSYAYCQRDQGINVTHCYCNANSLGNPYVLNGCQVVEECKHCHGDCYPRDEGRSSYNCYRSQPATVFTSSIAYIVIILAVAIGPLLAVFGCRWLYHFIKRRKTHRRVKFFKLKLLQHQSSSEGVVERTKLYTSKQLDKATSHFNENQILGKGGQGIVYKGMLTDGEIVAIKKPKPLDESQMEHFINEVVILSQINHRNVVKLLGCCLETDIPLLVYEFLSNGTLSQHIHDPDPDQDFTLSWPMRLKIAAESAGAIAYLHSSSSTPVYHRDIKPSNILLDGKYRAKVSDFGSSKTITLDQTHVTTLVQGTMGYLDPEYIESNTFTDKSDVYSFGVVLLELLTSRKPIYRTETMELKNLVTEFFIHMQNSSLSDILDPEAMKDAKHEELLAFVDLAKHCLNGSGRLRPTMKEVAMTLEMIIKSPAEMSARDSQTSLDKRFCQIVMPEMSNVEFMSTPIRATVASPLYIDEHPLLRDTI